MKIVKYPHPALRTPVKPVAAIDKEIVLAAGRMLDLMYASEGLGLAAPQVALDAQLLVMNFAGDPAAKDQEFVAINPQVVEEKGAVSDREGCLSFPGLYQNVRRFKTVKVQAYNLKGELYEMVCHDLPARVWQHEIDHLAGVLFIDKMGSLGRSRSEKDLEKFVADFERDKKKGDLPPGLEPRL
jgi:peptide deformylase